MSTIINRFSMYLESVEYPDKKTSWNIAGIVKGRNAFFKFDVRDMFNLPDGTPAQNGKINSKADKMVLEMKNKWIILDLEELHNFLKKNSIKVVKIEDLISKLDWNIILPK